MLLIQRAFTTCTRPFVRSRDVDIDPEELTATLLDKKYYLVDIIGYGGMGVVYRARDQLKRCDVAVKILLPRASKSLTRDTYNRFLERFRREAQVMQITHPQIVPVYGTGIADVSDIFPGERLAYLVMPYIKGKTLADKLAEGPFLLKDALLYIEQVADALTTAHKQGITHRDLKPGNFLLDESNRLYVADFGIAHLEGSTLTQAGEFLGTRGYAAPEVQRGGTIDTRADIYSLGIILFELLVGDTPFVLGNFQRTPFPEIDSVIQKATAEQPQDRYKTALEFVDALRSARDHLHREPTQFFSTAEMLALPKRLAQFARKPTFLSTPPSTRNLISGGAIVTFILLFTIFTIGSLISSHSPTLAFLYPNSVTPESVSPTSQPSPDLITQAVQTVQQYYIDWNNKDYIASYALLDPIYQQHYSYDASLIDYQQTHISCISIDNTTMQTHNQVKVSITDSAVEDDLAHPGQMVTHVYQGYFLVEQHPTGLKLSPHLSIQPNMTGSCHS
jgi:serine/threonine protein kinase